MPVRRAAVRDQVEQAADALGGKERHQNEREAQQNNPPVNPLDAVKAEIDIGCLPTGEPRRQKRNEGRPDHRAVKSAPPADGDPDCQIDGCDRCNLARTAVSVKMKSLNPSTG